LSVRRGLSVGLFVLGGVAAVISLYGMWFHVTIGPTYGPGLELGVVALALAAGCFCGAYWYGT
jgi:hypothetical protein